MVHDWYATLFTRHRLDAAMMSPADTMTRCVGVTW